MYIVQVEILNRAQSRKDATMKYDLSFQSFKDVVSIKSNQGNKTEKRSE